MCSRVSTGDNEVQDLMEKGQVFSLTRTDCTYRNTQTPPPWWHESKSWLNKFSSQKFNDQKNDVVTQ